MLVIMAALILKPKTSQISHEITTNVEEEIESFNLMASKIKRVEFPKIKYGVVRCSYVYFGAKTRLSLNVMGIKELETVSDEETLWLWCRSYDSKHVYRCRIEKLARTGLRKMLHPFIIRSISCCQEINGARLIGNVAVVEDKEFSKEIKLKDGRIQEQTLFCEGKPLVSMRILDFQTAGGVLLPRTVNLKLHNERIEVVVDMGEAIVNPQKISELPMPDLPEIEIRDQLLP